jgi:uncharacterized repeat protein (TIGR01451 family)
MNHQQHERSYKQFIMRTTLAIVFTMAAATILAVGQTSNGSAVKYPTYSVLAIGELKSNADADLAPLIEGKNDSLTEKEAAKRFGILYNVSGSQLSNTTVLELVDGTTNQTIKKVSLDEYFGKESATWKNVPAESETTATGSTSVYSVQKGKTTLKVVRDIRIVNDAGLPEGKRIDVTFSVEPNSAMKLKAKFNGKAEGGFSTKGNTFWIGNGDKTSPATIIVNVSPSPKIAAEGAKKGQTQAFTVSGGTVSAANGKKTPVLSFSVSGTTTRFADHEAEQVQNVRAYFENHTTKPKMVTVTSADKTTDHPGDTLTYTITSDNIGTGPAADIEINNKIPAGSAYIENSAEGEGSDITVTRGPVDKTGTGVANQLTWKFKTPISPGEERRVSFKVILL